MLIVRYTSNKENNSLEEAIKTKQVSTFEFVGEKNGKKETFPLLVVYSELDKKYSFENILTGKKEISSTKKGIIEKITKMLEKMNFKSLDKFNPEIKQENLDLRRNINEIEKIINFKEIEVKPKYIFFGPRIFKGIKLGKRKIEKAPYGYNIIDNFGIRIAYKKDMKTELFDGAPFEALRRTDYGYKIINSDGRQKAFSKDMKTKLFNGYRFEYIEKTDYGYNIIGSHSTVNAFGKDMKTPLFNGETLEKIEKKDYGYIVTNVFGKKRTYKEDAKTKIN